MFQNVKIIFTKFAIKGLILSISVAETNNNDSVN